MSDYGRSAEDILDGGAGGEWHRALALQDLDSAAYGVEEEFAYDDDEPARDLVHMAKELRTHLARLSVTKDAKLSLWRECRMCSGEGTVGGEKCIECGGVGSVHADEADG